MPYDRASLPRILPWAALVALLLQAGPAWSQDGGGLHKSDLVRLLTAGTHTQNEIAALVRRNCLSFRPTERDLGNLRLLGAGPAVMREIARCRSGEEGRETAAPRRTPPSEAPPRRPTPASEETAPPRTSTPAAADRSGGGAARSIPELTLFVSPRRATVRPGEEAVVTAEVTAGASAYRGVLLQLDEEGEDGFSAALPTDDGGRAVFRIPASGGPGLRRFTVSSPSGPLHGTGEVVVEMVAPDPGPPAGGEGTAAEPPGPEAEAVSDAREATSPGPAEGAGATGEGTDGEIDLPAALARAEALSLRGAYGEAGSLYERLLEWHPESVEVRVGYAYHLARRGAHARARTLLEDAGGAPDAPPSVRKARAFLALWVGEPEEAVEAFRALVDDVAAADAEAWRGLGRALMEVGREEEARRALRRARELEG